MLQAKLAELQHSAAQSRSEGRLVETGDAKDEGDRAVTSQTKDMLYRQTSQSVGLLNAVKAALARIEGGTFGVCLNCEQEIAGSRLKAIPWVRYCITCQGLIESQR